MQATVQLTPEAARELQAIEQQSHKTDARSAATRQLEDSIARLGVSIRPQFPGQTHPLLARYFLADIPDGVSADEVLAQLRRLDAVEAAYVSPPAEPPSGGSSG